MESNLGWIGLRRPAKVVHARKTDSSSSKRQKMMPADAELASLPDGVLSIVGKYLALPSRVMFAAALPSAGVQAVVPPGSVSVLDFEEVEKELAMRLSDDDLGAILACLACEGAHTLHKLKLANCLNITGRGLEPLRGSTALQFIDLSLVGQFESPEIEGGLLSETIVIPILQSIIDTEGNGLRYLALPRTNGRLGRAGRANPSLSFTAIMPNTFTRPLLGVQGKVGELGNPATIPLGLLGSIHAPFARRRPVAATSLGSTMATIKATRAMIAGQCTARIARRTAILLAIANDARKSTALIVRLHGGVSLKKGVPAAGANLAVRAVYL